ncbi:MAG: hypothetical protein J6R01_02790 [Alistipes sp.]|nr:hypothetical protein [Alistipes sp.]
MRVPCANRCLRWAFLLLMAMLVTSCSTHRYVANKEYPQFLANIEYDGILEEQVCKCSVDGPTERRMMVYLPKTYYDSDESYPVLYLLHGARGNELSWIEKGDLLHNIDSLRAGGLIREMIVVLPNVNQYNDDKDFNKSRIKGAVESLFETDGAVEAAFVGDVVNAVDSLYRTLPDKDHRAIAGLSIGAMQAMHISANAPDIFGYVGIFSAMVHPVLRKSDHSAFYKDFKDKLKMQFATPPMLYSIMIGNKDFYYPRMKCYVRFLKREGYPYEMTIVGGGHQWYNWTEFANQFMQRLF